MSRRARNRPSRNRIVGPNKKDFDRNGQDDSARSHSWWCPGGPRSHSQEDPRVGRRVGSIEGSRGRDGDRARSPSVPSPDLVGGDVSLLEWGASQDQCVGQHQGAFMISCGSTLAQSINSARWRDARSHQTQDEGKILFASVRLGANPGPHRGRKRRIPSESSESGLPGLSTTI